MLYRAKYFSSVDGALALRAYFDHQEQLERERLQRLAITAEKWDSGKTTFVKFLKDLNGNVCEDPQQGGETRIRLWTWRRLRYLRRRRQSATGKADSRLRSTTLFLTTTTTATTATASHSTRRRHSRRAHRSKDLFFLNRCIYVRNSLFLIPLSPPKINDYHVHIKFFAYHLLTLMNSLFLFNYIFLGVYESTSTA